MSLQINIDYNPFPHQLEAHNSSARFVAINGGRRAGKSEYAIQELIKHAIQTPDGLSWYLAPTYRDAKEIGWDKFKQHIPTLTPVISKINESELKVIWLNGHQTYFKGTDNRASLRGRGLTKAILDEVAFQHPDVWYTIVRPALMDKHGSAILITTPNGKNWFYQLYRDDSTFIHYTWPTAINPLITEDELSSIRDSLSLRDYRQEVLAEFVTAAGLVYDEFSEDNKTIDDIVFNEVRLGIDFGFANPTAVAFMDYNSIDDEVTQFDEIYEERKDIYTLIELINAKLRYYGISNVIIYTDPAGNAAELSSGISPVDALRKAGFVVRNKGSEIAPGVAMVRSFIRNANGKVRFKVHSRCKNAIRSLEGYTYDKRNTTEEVKEEPLKDGIHDHMCDAIRYYFVNRFDQAKYVSSSLPDVYYNREDGRKLTIMKRCVSCRRTFVSHTPADKPPFKCSACEGEE